MAGKAELRAPLSTERVLRAAMAMVDEGGIEALTMRKLGRALNVEAMSLYKHVAGKDEVLDGLIDLVEAEIELPVGGRDWAAAVRTCAISAHGVLQRHPWACTLIMTRFRQSRMRYMDWLLGRLHAAGFPPSLAFHAYHVLDSHILGYTLWEAGHAPPAGDLEETVTKVLSELPLADYPHFASHVDEHLHRTGHTDVTGFEFGLDLILAGLKRLRATARQ
jgi:AcrR family transcriptional regulator